jgi:hypothetical protein
MSLDGGTPYAGHLLHPQIVESRWFMGHSSIIPIVSFEQSILLWLETSSLCGQRF